MANSLLHWLEYFEVKSTPEIPQSPKFQNLLNIEAFQKCSSYYFHGDVLNLMDNDTIYGFMLEGSVPICISATTRYPIAKP